MKRYLIPIMVVLVLASGLVVGCGQEVKPTPTIQPDVPTMTQDEVCALVYSYLEARGNAMTDSPKRLEILFILNGAFPHFRATYQSNGKWQVWAVGNDGVGTSGNLTVGWGGLWDVYENSGVIEPANDKARELLSYIQWYTR